MTTQPVIFRAKRRYRFSAVMALAILVGLLAIAVPVAYAQDIYLETWKDDDFGGTYRVFTPGDGDIENLGDYGWNDEIRSIVLHGPPGTAVWLYDKKHFEIDDDVLEVRIPEGTTSVAIPRLDEPPESATWQVHKNGLAGKVSGIRWEAAPISNRFVVRLEHLQLVQAQGDSLLHPGNEPYFVLVAFKSHFGIPGSTGVRWHGYLDDGWAEGIEEGETRAIPGQMGQAAYYNIDVDDRFQILGVVVVAMEHDGMPWHVVREVIDQIVDNLRSGLVEIVEEQNLTPAVLEKVMQQIQELDVGFWAKISVLLTTLGNKDDLVGFRVVLFVHPSLAALLPSTSSVAIQPIGTQEFTLRLAGSDSVYDVLVSTDYSE